MPDLAFQVQGAEPIRFAAEPLLALKLRITNVPADQAIHSIALRCQIQIEAPARIYATREEEGLRDLFGERERWGQTLKKFLWTHVNAMVPPFSGSIVIDLPVLCSYDLAVAATKYFHALEEGTVPLSLLFSGTIFHRDEDGLLQVAQIPWTKETSYRLPVSAWQETIDLYFPNAGFLVLRRDLLDRLYRHRMKLSLPSWEHVIDALLPPEDGAKVPGGPVPKRGGDA